MDDSNSAKLCECGCGQPAPIAKKTRKHLGHVKGEPVRFVPGHNADSAREAHVAKSRASHPERFWVKVNTSGECWEWLAHRNEYGYGTYRLNNASTHAHRVAYELLIGPIPEGLEIDHLCRNRGCVNPAHMEPVTGRENTMRGISITAVNTAKTHCPQGHEFTPENTRITPTGKRVCRACQRQTSLEYYHAKHGKGGTRWKNRKDS